MMHKLDSRKLLSKVRWILPALFVGCHMVNGVYAQVTNDATAAPSMAATASAATHRTIDKTERVVSDSWITTKVKSEILANSLSKAFKVGVKTKYGVVLLSGKLPNQDAIDLVRMIAEKVNGVRSVDVTRLSINP